MFIQKEATILNILKILFILLMIESIGAYCFFLFFVPHSNHTSPSVQKSVENFLYSPNSSTRNNIFLVNNDESSTNSSHTISLASTSIPKHYGKIIQFDPTLENHIISIPSQSIVLQNLGSKKLQNTNLQYALYDNTANLIIESPHYAIEELESQASTHPNENWEYELLSIQTNIQMCATWSTGLGNENANIDRLCITLQENPLPSLTPFGNISSFLPVLSQFDVSIPSQSTLVENIGNSTIENSLLGYELYDSNHNLLVSSSSEIMLPLQPNATEYNHEAWSFTFSETQMDYRICALWKTEQGNMMDTDCINFSSIPTLGWWMWLLLISFGILLPQKNLFKL